MKILIINGANLNLLGIREKEIYGEKNYADLKREIKTHAAKNGVKVKIKQSNHEGKIVDFIQRARLAYDAIIINAGAYTHTSVAVLDALKAVSLPTVEVHLSDISARESFRKLSYVGLYAEKSIIGQGFAGYLSALDYLKQTYNK